MKSKLNLSYWVLERLNLDYTHLRNLAQEHMADLEHLRDYGDSQMVNITPEMVRTADYALFALEETCQYDGDKNRHFQQLMEFRALPATRESLLCLIEAECMRPVRIAK